VATVVLGLVLVNAGIAVVISLSAHKRATAWPGPGFTFWPERKWQDVERRVAALRLPARAESSVWGTVTYRQGSFPVHLIRIRPVRQDAHPLRVLLTGGVHGTEPAGVEALLRFVEQLSADPARLSGALIDVLPVVNPWGYVYGYRYNGDGQDVNRDYASRRTQEARLVRALFQEDGPYDLVMDLHESKKPGYFLYEYVSPSRGLGRVFAGLVSTLGQPPENAYREWIFPARDGVLRTPAAALAWVALARSLSLDQYARLHGTADSYTVETPVEDDLAERVAVDLRAVSSFITALTRAPAAR
jgi:hypothetical protein